jgi:alpha-tubulin suppressor-like RCC1 family protein
MSSGSSTNAPEALLPRLQKTVFKVFIQMSSGVATAAASSGAHEELGKSKTSPFYDLPPELQQRELSYLSAASLGCLAATSSFFARCIHAEVQQRLSHGLFQDTLSDAGESMLQLIRFREIRSTVQVEAGRCQTFIANEDGEVLACGLLGRLALLGMRSTERTPTELVWDNAAAIRRLAAGHTHTLLLSNNGIGYSCGFGLEGRLGHGTMFDNSLGVPTAIAQPINIVAISAGASHSVVLTQEGVPLTFGFGGDGRLGHGDEQSCSTPKPIQLYDDDDGESKDQKEEPVSTSSPPDRSGGEREHLRFRTVSAGGSHSLMIDVNEHCWTFGCSSHGQLGLGLTHGKRSLRPRRIRRFVFTEYDSDGGDDEDGDDGDEDGDDDADDGDGVADTMLNRCCDAGLSREAQLYTRFHNPARSESSTRGSMKPNSRHPVMKVRLAVGGGAFSIIVTAPPRCLRPMSKEHNEEGWDCKQEEEGGEGSGYNDGGMADTPYYDYSGPNCFTCGCGGLGQLGQGIHKWEDALVPTQVFIKASTFRKVRCGEGRAGRGGEHVDHEHAGGEHVDHDEHAGGEHVDHEHVHAFGEWEEHIASAAAGGSHSLLLSSAGRVFVCGNGEHGRLGSGSTSNLMVPTLLKMPTILVPVRRCMSKCQVQCQCLYRCRCRVLQVTAGGLHSALVVATTALADESDGAGTAGSGAAAGGGSRRMGVEVLVFGGDEYGQLGLGEDTIDTAGSDGGDGSTNGSGRGVLAGGNGRNHVKPRALVPTRVRLQLLSSTSSASNGISASSSASSSASNNKQQATTSSSSSSGAFQF